MEQTRKNLKTSSIIVLALAGLSLLNALFEIFFGELNKELKGAVIPEGAPDNVVLIAQIFVLVISFLFFLPQLYIGIKGLKISKKPDSSKAHIVWGIILVVWTAIGLLSPLFALIQGNGNTFENFASVCSIAVDVFILFEYVKYARAVRKGL
jgi:hypothetical protein